MPGFNLLLSSLFAIAWLSVSCWKFNLKTHFLSAFAKLTLISVVFCLLWNWQHLGIFTSVGFYPQDSIYTLGLVNALFVACVTITMIVGFSFINWSITEHYIARLSVSRWQAGMIAFINIVLVLVVYWLVLSLIPQFYYIIYLQLFPDLPSQWVVRKLIPVMQFFAILLFIDTASLSNHAAGLLGWILAFNTLIQWLSRDRIQLDRSAAL